MGLREHIEEEINKDYELLKKLNDTLRTETDPRLELRWTEDINKVKLRIRQYEEELKSLSACPVQPEPVTSELKQRSSTNVTSTFVPSPPAPKTGILSSKLGRLSALLGSTALGLVLIFSAFLLKPPSLPPSDTVSKTPSENSSSNVQPSQQPTPTPPSEPTLISKITGVDYTRLHDLLAAGKWKDADIETTKAMRKAGEKIAGSEEVYFTEESIKKLPCEDLGIIDRLWLEFSQKQFGFSIQKDIYENLGGKYDNNKEVWSNFATKLGWDASYYEQGQKHFAVNYYNELTFNLNAPKGSLPVGVTTHDIGGSGKATPMLTTESSSSLGEASLLAVLSRVAECKL